MTATNMLSRFKEALGLIGQRAPIPKEIAAAPDPIEFSGNYTSWKDVLGASTGYDSDIILQRTRVAQMKVKTGEAVFQRDSVIFDKAELPWSLIACLLNVAARENGRLSVLDFGGALGSSYFTCRGFLECLQSLRWSVIEQSAYVLCGKEEFQDDRLRFYKDIAECLENETPNVLVLSGVLMYLENPSKFLADLPFQSLEYILADQTMVFMDGTPDRLTLQKVPEYIYPASYPCWMLNYGKLLQSFTPDYEVLSEFPAHVGVTMPFENQTVASYAGFFLRKKSAGVQEQK